MVSIGRLRPMPAGGPGGATPGMRKIYLFSSHSNYYVKYGFLWALALNVRGGPGVQPPAREKYTYLAAILITM